MHLPQLTASMVQHDEKNKGKGAKEAQEKVEGKRNESKRG
jgi:hypothetical protein